MSEQAIQQATTAFLAQFIPTDTLGPDDNIFHTGLVNSLFAMQLVLFVEKHFGITVENEDLDLENFQSINAITRLVLRKQLAGVQ